MSLLNKQSMLSKQLSPKFRIWIHIPKKYRHPVAHTQVLSWHSYFPINQLHCTSSSQLLPNPILTEKKEQLLVLFSLWWNYYCLNIGLPQSLTLFQEDIGINLRHMWHLPVRSLRLLNIPCCWTSLTLKPGTCGNESIMK